jgi:pimeloyl-ACP methyl ester carboxylesterase
MTTTTATWSAEIGEIAGVRLELVKGGSGEPLLILHDVLGHRGWLRYHEALAQHYTLYIPSHPGFGRSERLDWVMHVRDLAGWYVDALETLGVGRVPVIGLGLGGWLAASMASMCPHQFKKLVLVAAFGIKPPEGEIFDMFLVVARQYIAASFLDPANTPEYQQLYGANPTPEQAEAWEVARETSSLLAWRPYMHDPSLPHLLRRLRHLPTLIVWGRQDTIMPLSAAQVYNASIPGSRLVVLEHCGHHPEIEQADAFVRLVQEFLAAA